MPRPRLRSGHNGVVDAPSAFLNIPYDEEFVDLYLAYIAGVAAFGIIPRTSLEIPGGERRLDRIFGLIQTCRYSFHDLSRVQLDEHRPPTPRFKMPFELGLTVAWDKLNPGTHSSGGDSAFGARTFYELRIFAGALARHQILPS